MNRKGPDFIRPIWDTFGAPPSAETDAGLYACRRVSKIVQDALRWRGAMVARKAKISGMDYA